MPDPAWSFCTPRVLRQAWYRLRTGRLCQRHGLLLGWMLPPFVMLMSKASSLPAVTLPLTPALVIAFCPPMIDVVLSLEHWWSGCCRLADTQPQRRFIHIASAQQVMKRVEMPVKSGA